MMTLGIVSLIFGAAFCGFYMAHLYEKRYKQLADFLHGIQIFETELMYGHTPLHEAFQIVSEQTDPAVSKLFADFSEKLQDKEVQVESAWRTIHETHEPYMAFSKADCAVLYRLAEGLGKHDLLTEQKQLQNFMLHLQMQCEKAKEKVEKESKMVRSLGVLIGLLFVIILV